MQGLGDFEHRTETSSAFTEVPLGIVERANMVTKNGMKGAL